MVICLSGVEVQEFRGVSGPVSAEWTLCYFEAFSDSLVAPCGIAVQDKLSYNDPMEVIYTRRGKGFAVLDVIRLETYQGYGFYKTYENGYCIFDDLAVSADMSLRCEQGQAALLEASAKIPIFYNYYSSSEDVLFDFWEDEDYTYREGYSEKYGIDYNAGEYYVFIDAGGGFCNFYAYGADSGASVICSSDEAAYFTANQNKVFILRYEGQTLSGREIAGLLPEDDAVLIDVNENGWCDFEFNGVETLSFVCDTEQFTEIGQTYRIGYMYNENDLSMILYGYLPGSQ